jgi:hypothetical protein
MAQRAMDRIIGPRTFQIDHTTNQQPLPPPAGAAPSSACDFHNMAFQDVSQPVLYLYYVVPDLLHSSKIALLIFIILITGRKKERIIMLSAVQSICLQAVHQPQRQRHQQVPVLHRRPQRLPPPWTGRRRPGLATHARCRGMKLPLLATSPSPTATSFA